MNDESSLLLTDLYQLTMAHAYYEQGMEDDAVFELFFRTLPPERNFLLATGLEQLVEFIKQARFRDQEVDWLRRTGRFPGDFLDHLAGFRFTGALHAMPEGTLCFPDEPVVRVVAPIAQAQLLESRLVNLVHFQTLLASKAARCMLAAPGKQLVDFGLRRAHGAEAGLLAARASYLTGFAGTATVLAGQRFGIPIFGTMAHSYIQAHADEAAAFEGFAHAQRNNVTLLIDTYDTEAGAHKVVALAPRLAADGIQVQAVRLDSGDLAEHARQVRAILDAGGLAATKIFASGNLDEHSLHALAQEAPIDGFGVGTRLDTSADAPYLDCAYKLTEYAGRPRRKKSEGKQSWPGRKQVYRHYHSSGEMAGDVITLEEDRQEGEPLLIEIMQQGKRLRPPESLDTVRARVREQMQRLPTPLRGLAQASPYAVTLAPAILKLAEEADRWPV